MSDDFRKVWIPEARGKITKHLNAAKKSRDCTKPDGWYRQQHAPVIAALEAALAAFDASIAASSLAEAPADASPITPATPSES